jgi:hypothetical protein
MSEDSRAGTRGNRRRKRIVFIDILVELNGYSDFALPHPGSPLNQGREKAQ